MDENDESTEISPEEVPQDAPNLWDVLRVLMMPLIGFFQGVNVMFDSLTSLFILQSQIHDEKKASQEIEDLLK